MIRDIGDSKRTRNISLEEIVAIFVNIVAYQQKNRTINGYSYRSGETMNRQFNLCLKAILK